MRWVIGGLVGLAALIAIATVAFWRATRPPRLSTDDPWVAAAAGTSPETATSTWAAASATASAPVVAAPPARIPAAVVLATPRTPIVAPLPVPDLDAEAGSDADADADAGAGAEAVGAGPVDSVPDAPEVIDVNDTGVAESLPLSVADLPSEGDTEIEDDEPRPRASLPAPPARPVIDLADAEPVAETGGVDTDLISALAALPNRTPTPVVFDDPPVERVVAPVEVAGSTSVHDVAAPTDPPAQPESAPIVDPELPPEVLRDRSPADEVDDMALMASALSSLPQLDWGDLGPGPDAPLDTARDTPGQRTFFDQDLDPGPPPGQPPAD